MFLLLAYAVAQPVRHSCPVDKPTHVGTDPDLAWQQHLSVAPLHKAQADADQVYVIPTVVHVIHNGGTDSIDAATIQAQFRLLHAQFRNLPGSPLESAAAADMQLDFQLATRDPSGNPTTGIVYVRNTQYLDMGGITLASNAGLKALSLWDPNRYCNIWIVRSITPLTTGGAGVLGYAQFPDPLAVGSLFSLPQTDGVVMVNNQLGSLSTNSSQITTLVHELGHWLGLYHTYQGGCAETDCRSQGDWVCDTPPALENLAKPLEGRFNSCLAGQPDLPDQTRNIMDAVNDVSTPKANVLTPGQRKRVHGFLTSATVARRYPLWQEANLEATGTGKWGPLEPIFHANNTRTYVGMPVTFQDFTRNTPTEYSWSFAGNPNVDLTNPAAPIVVWNAPGTYTVSLTVSNTYGSASTTRQNLITVLAEQVALPYTEGFAFANYPGKLWVENPDSAKASSSLSRSWRHTEQGGVLLNGLDLESVVIQNRSYGDAGQADYIRLPYFNLSAVGCAELALRLAYQPVYVSTHEDFFYEESLAALFADTLVIEGSIDGGAHWARLFRAGGLDLMTTAHPDTLINGNIGGGLVDGILDGGQSDAQQLTESYKWFRIKTPTDWQAEPVVQLRIKNITGGGGDLFIDSLSLTPSTDCVALPPPPVGRAAAAAQAAARQLRVFPQPAGDYVQLGWAGTADLSGPLLLLDAQGRTVREYGLLSLHPASVSPELSLAELPAGMYWLRWAQLPATPVLKP
ncbi:MAG: M43 family zinc metalloprotease [Sphingobacteriia bacterium]